MKQSGKIDKPKRLLRTEGRIITHVDRLQFTTGSRNSGVDEEVI